ncbi:MAG: hypothetical protein K1X53_02520 [Candidatus Sumerlaeaceae bacterium]|nr:hypothetical protein [Candidatus Sumerlaeaceae bacterium]
MTLAIGVPYSKGLLVCCDRGLPDGEEQKLFRLRPDAAFSTVGWCKFATSHPQWSFDTRVITQAFFERGSGPIEAAWEPFGQYIANSWHSFTRRVEMSSLFSSLSRNNDFLFSIMGYYLPNSQSIAFAFTHLHLADHGRPKVTQKISNCPKTGKAQVYVAGCTVLPKAIAAGESSVSHLVNKPIYQKFYQVRPSIPTICEAEALEVAITLIADTSADTRNEFGHKVSRTCDCAVLEYGSGFRWLHNPLVQ